MTKQTLKATLEALAHEQYAKFERLEKEAATKQKNLKEIDNQIEALTIKRMQLIDEVEQISTQLKAMQRLKIPPQLKAVQTALSESATELSTYIQLINESQEKKKAFLEAHPEITPDLLAEFEKFESDPETALQALPKSYQQGVMQLHQARKNTLTPYFQIQREIQQIEEQEVSPTVQLILAQVKNDFIWVVPIQYEPQNLPASMEDRLDEVLQTLLNAILKLAQDKDWVFAGIDEECEPWLGYWTMTTLMEYSGTMPIAEHAQLLLRETLVELPFDLQVTEISPSIWKEGLKYNLKAGQTQLMGPLIEAKPTRIPLSERTGGWYRDEDIISWERPLNVSEESKWNVQGRRLRTALTNMVMKGLIDNPSMPAGQLWLNLPEPHQSAMKYGVIRLLENEVLIADGDQIELGIANVAINSNQIQRVQSLINRDIDDFWHPLIVEM